MMTRSLMRLPEVMNACGISRSLIYRLAKEGRFPRPVRVSSRLSVWDSTDVQAWVDQRCGGSPIAGPTPDGGAQ